MKSFLSITLALLFAFNFETNAQSSAFDLDAEEWREDLQHLTETVHEDYSFLFKKISAEKFDEAVATLHHEIPNMEDHEIVVGLTKLVAMFGWGHTSLRILPFGDHSPAGFGRLPFNLYHFSDGIYVQAAHKDYAEAVGGKVLAIGKTPIDEALELLRPVVSVENEQFFKAFGIQGLGVVEVLHAQGIIDDLLKVDVLLEKNGKQYTVTFKYPEPYFWPAEYGLVFQHGDNLDWVDARSPDSYAQSPNYLKNLNKNYWFEYDAITRTVYAQQNLVRNADGESIAQFYGRLSDFVEDDKNQVDKLILDLRLNSGGNNFLNVPVIQNLIRAEKINQQGKLFVVIGRRTYSACQNLVNELETYTEAIFVGEPTGENVNMYGDNREVALPNSGLVAQLSFAWWQNKAPWDTRQSTEPTLAADLSYTDFVNNVDPVMKVIHDYADGKNPVTHLQHLFAEGNMEELAKAAKSYVNDPIYRYISFETDINDGGYQLMAAGKKKMALELFRVNTELYPGSANVWDSYAEAHLELEMIDDAIRLYKKAINLDPHGFVGDNARAMLDKINGIVKAHGNYDH